MSDYLAQVASVVRATTILPGPNYAWFGRPGPGLASQVRRLLTPMALREYLRYQLQGQLYRDFYCQGTAAVPRDGSPGQILLGLTTYVERLMNANCGGGYHESGWQVVDTADDVSHLVSRNDLTLRARAEEYLAAPSATAGEVRLRFPKDLPGVSPGFYMALSDVPLASEDAASLLRLYFNLDPDGAVRLMATVTRLLNGARILFRLKALNDPAFFARRDVAVLYLRASDFATVRPLLRDVYAALAGSIRSGVPALTRQLAPGLGLAEDPGGGDSFGLQRCLILAEGLIRAHEAGKRRFDARLRLVLDYLADAGISIEQPYLRPGSRDTYDFEPSESEVAPAIRSLACGEEDPAHEVDFLQVAVGIGRRLAATAIWHEDQCNWVDSMPAEDNRQDNAGPTVRALGPDLYAGTSGIALFLAELSVVSQEPELRRTALGAINQALRQAAQIAPAARLGLYTGWVGLALAAVRVSALLGAGEPVARACRLLGTLREQHIIYEHDYLSGTAGAIVGLLVLEDLLGDEALRDLAIDLGAELIEAAQKTGRGFSWQMQGLRTGHNLTGLAHGAAGIGFALLELAAVTGDARYRQAAEMAYDYERSYYDQLERNWLDLRVKPGRGSGRTRRAFATYWCHGAPGIGLTRLRAYQLLGTPNHIAEAQAALATTYESAERELLSGHGDFCLCHGLAGKAEVLLTGAISGEKAQRESTTALNIARVGARRYASDEGRRTRGVAGPETSGLMLGLAGIGLFYLRMHNPRTPSVMLFHPGLW